MYFTSTLFYKFQDDFISNVNFTIWRYLFVDIFWLKNSPSAHLNCTLPVFLLICMKIIFPLRKFFDLYQAILEGLIYLTDVNLDDINAKDYDKYKNY